MKKLIAFCIVLLPLAGLSSFALAAMTNGGFESGMTAKYADDGSNYGCGWSAAKTEMLTDTKRGELK
jgi:hypothetical protein